MNCSKCNVGEIQITSWVNIDDSATTVYGCNKCSYGWGEHSDIEEKIKKLLKLAYIGEHYFPDLTYKRRYEEMSSDIIILRKQLAEAVILVEKLKKLRVLRVSCEESNDGQFRIHLLEKEWDEILKLINQGEYNE